jgi:uncharacterized protein (DUF1697 family)
MQIWIALLRGINVGGNNILPMKDLRGLLDDLGYENARTYIQSGNCVFQSGENEAGKLEGEIGSAIEKQFGFRPHVFVLTLDALDEAIAANPYPQANDDPKSLHFSFLAKPARDVDLGALEALKADNEAFTLTDAVFYLYAPDGIGRSKLAAKTERHLAVPMTGRNLRSVLKITELARGI